MKAEFIQAHFYELEKSFKIDWSFEFNATTGGYMVRGIFEGKSFAFHSYDVKDKNDINQAIGVKNVSRTA